MPASMLDRTAPRLRVPLSRRNKGSLDAGALAEVISTVRAIAEQTEPSATRASSEGSGGAESAAAGVPDDAAAMDRLQEVCFRSCCALPFIRVCGVALTPGPDSVAKARHCCTFDLLPTFLLHPNAAQKLDEAWRWLSKADTENVFAQPVTEAIAPNYFKFIKKPMDLATIRSRIGTEVRAYRSVKQFEASSGGHPDHHYPWREIVDFARLAH